MAIGGLGGSVAKKILVSIDVMTDAAQEKLQQFERQTRRATTSVEKSVTGNVSQAQSQLDQFMGGMRGIGPAAKDAENRTRGLNDRIATFGKDAKFASDMTKQFRMDMLSVMFAGMQLSAVFGGMMRKMLSFTGAADAMGAAMKSVLLPITMAIQPILLSLAEVLIEMDRSQKFVVGLTVVLLALAGAATFLGAQIVMLSGALAGSTIALFGFEVALTALLGLFGALVSGLLIGIGVVAFFGKKVGAIVGVLAALGAVIAAVLGAPLWIIIGLIAIVIGVIIALKDDIINLVKAGGKALGKFAKNIGQTFDQAVKDVKNMWRGFKKWIGFIYRRFSKLGEQVWSALKKVGRFIDNSVSWLVSSAAKLGKRIVSGVLDYVSKLPSKVWNFMTSTADKIRSAVSQISSAAMSIGSKIIDKIAEGMQNAPDAIMNAIKKIAPDWVVDVLGKAGSAISGGVETITDTAGNIINVNDFVMTPNGDVLKTAPDDFIFGTKTPGALAGGGGGNQVTINIDAEVSDEIDMRELARRVGDQIDRKTGGRSNIGRSGQL